MNNGKDNPHGLAPLGVPLSGGPDAEEHLCDDCLAERQARVCPCCGEFFRNLNAEEAFCSDCNSEHPYALLKATVDQGFVYALGLRDGTIVVFSGAAIHGAYVALELGERVLEVGDLALVFSDALQDEALGLLPGKTRLKKRASA